MVFWEDGPKPRISRLHRIARAVEFAQIGQPAHRQPVGIPLAGFHQRLEIFRHLGARFGAGRGGAVEQEIIGHHDTVDGGFDGSSALVHQTHAAASNSRNRPVGEANPVEFAAVKYLHDDCQQTLVGGEVVGNGAAAAQIIGGDGIGVADHLDVHHLQSALDQHGCSPIRIDKPEVAKKFHYRKPAVGNPPRRTLETPIKRKRTGPENPGRCAWGSFETLQVAAGLLMSPAWPDPAVE